MVFNHNAQAFQKIINLIRAVRECKIMIPLPLLKEFKRDSKL